MKIQYEVFFGNERREVFGLTFKESDLSLHSFPVENTEPGTVQKPIFCHTELVGKGWHLHGVTPYTGCPKCNDALEFWEH